MRNGLAPTGTPLHIRLTSTVGSYASRAGSPISAILIAPVVVDGQTVLPAGTAVLGIVKTVRRVGLGIRYETARLDFAFNHLTSGNGESIPISARVAEVDNGRERVDRIGQIHGIRSTGSLCYRVSGYIRTMLQWEVHAQFAQWAIRSLLVQLPEPEIYYPAGVELTLVLTENLFVSSYTGLEQSAPPLNADERAELSRFIASMPDRTYSPGSGRPSDLTNVLVIGSRDRVLTAFSAAGWTQANPASLRRRIEWIRAVAERRGYEAGPMSPLLLRDAQPDMSWEKGLNDVSKRHHVRMWNAGTWRGQELRIGAATRDIDFAFLRPGKKLTHRIEVNIDQERDKLAYDLAFTSCANLLDWTERPGLPRVTRNATGDSMITDTGVAVIGLNDCHSPRLTAPPDIAPVPPYGGKLQRFLRREILSARNELIRNNRYWRSYEAGHWLVNWLRRRMRQDPVQDSEGIKFLSDNLYQSTRIGVRD